LCPVTIDPADSVSAPAARRRRWWRCLVAAGLLGALFLTRAPLLRGLAGLLVAEDSGRSVTALWVLRGDGVYAEAARQLREGEAAEVWLIEEAPRRLQSAGVLPAPTETDRRALQSRGVPDEAIHVLLGTALDDWDRVRVLQGWLREHPEDQVAVLCDRFGSSRLRLIMDRVLGSDAQRVHLAALADRRYDETNWWSNKDGMVAVWNGFTQFLYVSLAGEGDGPGPSWDADAWEWSLP
jgi:hypothetical protein